MANCKDHHEYATREEAEQEMARLIRRAKRTGEGGTSWKRLNVFPCGNHYHVGRANQPHRPPKPAPTEKLPSMGDLLRQIRHVDEQYDRMTDYFHRKRAALIGKIIEAERTRGDIE